MHLLFKKYKKIKLNGFSTKNFKLLNGPKFNFNVYQYHSPQKHSLQNSTHNLNFEIYFQFFIVCDVFIST